MVIRDLRVARGGRTVLHDLSLDIETSALTGLIGPSGCGKTTLMRSIVGVQRVAAGTVAVLGEPAGGRTLRSRVGYVTQAPAVYDDLTVRENLRYFGRVLRAPRDSVDRVLQTVDLTELAGQLAGRLSGGERARVSLATALLNDPGLLVLDEPTVGLDPVLRRDLWGAFRALASRGTTLLVSSHVMDEAERCDRLVLMREGAVLASEAPAALLARTAASTIDAAFLRLVEARELAV